MRSTEVQRDLFHVAKEQGGYFTAKQAASLGYLAIEETTMSRRATGSESTEASFA